MIVIKDSDFEMVQVKTSPFFNLSILTPINEGKENERFEMKLFGYGMTFEQCIKEVVNLKLSRIDKTITVSEYIKLYAEEVNKIERLVQTIDKKEVARSRKIPYRGQLFAFCCIQIFSTSTFSPDISSGKKPIRKWSHSLPQSHRGCQ